MHRQTRLNATALALGCALAVANCATPAAKEEPVEHPYVILDENASVPFGSSTVRGFRVGEDRSLLLEAAGGRWYRATLDPICRSSLPWEQAIGFPEKAFDRVDKFSFVIIDGQRCAFRTFDEIADPRAAITKSGAD